MLPYSNVHLPTGLNAYTFTCLFIRSTCTIQDVVILNVARSLNESTFQSSHGRYHFVNALAHKTDVRVARVKKCVRVFSCAGADLSGTQSAKRCAVQVTRVAVRSLSRNNKSTYTDF